MNDDVLSPEEAKDLCEAEALEEIFSLYKIARNKTDLSVTDETLFHATIGFVKHKAKATLELSERLSFESFIKQLRLEAKEAN